MDGLFHGKPYEQMDDLGGFPPLFLVQHPYIMYTPKKFHVWKPKVMKVFWFRWFSVEMGDFQVWSQFPVCIHFHDNFIQLFIPFLQPFPSDSNVS